MQKNDVEDITYHHNDYEIVQRDVLYQGVFRLARYQIRHRLFNGGWSEIFSREVFERFSAAAVLPYDPILDRVILIEQFRPGSIGNPKGPWLIEIPAGVITENNKPEEVAQHEAEEEAGCHILKLESICEYFVSPGGANEFLNLYCGKIDASEVKGVHGLPQEHEDIRVINIPAENAFDMLKTGQIKTSPAIISLLWLQQNRDRLKQLWER